MKKYTMWSGDVDDLLIELQQSISLSDSIKEEFKNSCLYDSDEEVDLYEIEIKSIGKYKQTTKLVKVK